MGSVDALSVEVCPKQKRPHFGDLRPHRRARGFTIVEATLVIAVIGVMAAVALPMFANLRDSAEMASLNGIAGSLRASVQLVHSKWLAAGNDPTIKSVLMGDGSVVGVSSTGWPENDNAPVSNDSVNAVECLEVWNGVLLAPPSAAVVPGEDFEVAGSGFRCRYIAEAPSGWEIVYDIRDGAIDVIETPAGGGPPPICGAGPEALPIVLALFAWRRRRLQIDSRSD